MPIFRETIFTALPIQLAGWLIVAVTAAVLTGLVGKHDD